MGRPNRVPSSIAARKGTPPQSRERPHSFSNCVQVAQRPSTMSFAGVIPGSTTEDPLGAGTDQLSASLPRKRRATCACAARNDDDPDGYSGWSATSRYSFHCW